MDFDWHVFVYPCERSDESGEKSSGGDWGDFGKSTFEMAFDEFLEKMNRLPTMFMELDGSFVWRGEGGNGESGDGGRDDDGEDGAWQVDGVVAEKNERVAFLEVKGAGSRAPFKQILELLEWPKQTVCFELPRQGTRCTAEQFFA